MLYDPRCSIQAQLGSTAPAGDDMAGITPPLLPAQSAQLPLPKWRRHMLSGYCTCDRKPRARARAGATDSAGTAAAAPASAAGGGARIHFTISCWSNTCTVTVRCSRRGPSRNLALDSSHASAAELASPAGAGTPHRAAAGWRGGGAPGRWAGGTPECRPAAWKQPVWRGWGSGRRAVAWQEEL